VHSGLVLSRPPLLTKLPTPFEESFYFYQKRLNERLTLPFTRYFYYKKDTPAFIDWKLKAKERNWQPARELGGYNAYAEDAWNDEILVGSDLSKTAGMVDKLVKESVVRAVEGKDGQVREVGVEEQEKETASDEAKEDSAVTQVKPFPRATEADRAKELTRLDRKLHRTLYLCVKRANGGWGFPAGAIEGRENLHDVSCFHHCPISSSGKLFY
jgi:large subunit ribosomal protein L46